MVHSYYYGCRFNVVKCFSFIICHYCFSISIQIWPLLCSVDSGDSGDLGEFPIPGGRISFERLTAMPTVHVNQTPIVRSFIPDDNGPFTRQGDPAFTESVFRRSQGHFNRERIPERVVHAKGSTYYGVFRVTNAKIAKYTKASLFDTVGKETRFAVRFSTQLGERGSADTPFGEIRGVGIKFYTEDGNYDLLFINTPVFFINDPQLFPHINHAQKRDPRTDLRDANNLWDFISRRPETLNGITFVYSDYGQPDGFRHMPAFSVNTFRFVSKDGKRFYVRYTMLPLAGIRNLRLSESFRLAGEDPDYARRDLYEAVENGQRPSWALYVQVITAQEIDNSFTYNPFDPTKIWPIENFPLEEIGILTLDRNVENAFAENEQIALNPASLVPGIEPSPDRILLGRMFAYLDTQFYRLGANHLLIPINRDGRKILSERDGFMRTDDNYGSLPNYYPNREFNEQPWLYDITAPPFSFSFVDIAVMKPDTIQSQYQHARETYESFSPDEQDRLHFYLAFALNMITKQDILERMLAHLVNISPRYGQGVRRSLMDLKQEQSTSQRVSSMY
ncbi:vegetative catalase [Dermatophagoides farinae]|uniref:vegetative catalase n=1 Tax=Dermatophagoides farinae TaxID=6954 RepID=UPI003F62C656